MEIHPSYREGDEEEGEEKDESHCWRKGSEKNPRSQLTNKEDFAIGYREKKEVYGVLALSVSALTYPTGTWGGTVLVRVSAQRGWRSFNPCCLTTRRAAPPQTGGFRKNLFESSPGTSSVGAHTPLVVEGKNATTPLRRREQ